LEETTTLNIALAVECDESSAVSAVLTSDNFGDQLGSTLEEVGITLTDISAVRVLKVQTSQVQSINSTVY
jgi:hypothetical protein